MIFLSLLEMAEAAQDVDKVIIDCLAYFTKKARGGGGRTLTKEKQLLMR